MILPLFVLLFAIEFSIVAGKILSDYESSMSDEYNIIAVSQKELSDEVFKSRIPSFKNAILLDAKPVLDRLKGQMSDKNLKELENSLPKFYSIKLNILPSPTFMAKIERDLLGIEGISKVETFAKTHDKVYRILVLFKAVAQGFTALIALMGITGTPRPCDNLFISTLPPLPVSSSIILSAITVGIRISKSCKDKYRLRSMLVASTILIMASG